ncbi:hypothetical protein PoB_006564800 [Plakobranchus ocellatus]|uniref:Uncharacterized protein n=1 Tax=Plakobranchus ocellatus TaxID=259542 RepID=A0AAV4D534_9GAST|nr:hypothetical protein PoB_006564800 [Plakobranchus ocellatus]
MISPDISSRFDQCWSDSSRELTLADAAVLVNEKVYMPALTEDMDILVSTKDMDMPIDKKDIHVPVSAADTKMLASLPSSLQFYTFKDTCSFEFIVLVTKTEIYHDVVG